MKKDSASPTTILPTIATIEPEGKNKLYITFTRPLDRTQTMRVREICLALQNANESFLFSCTILLRMPEDGKRLPLRQIDTGGTVLLITRPSGNRPKPTLEAIRTSVIGVLGAYAAKAPA